MWFNKSHNLIPSICAALTGLALISIMQGDAWSGDKLKTHKLVKGATLNMAVGLDFDQQDMAYLADFIGNRVVVINVNS